MERGVSLKQRHRKKTEHDEHCKQTLPEPELPTQTVSVIWGGIAASGLPCNLDLFLQYYRTKD